MQNEQLLQKINSPADLKMLTLDEMKLLAGEIRQLIIDVVSKNGGHLAPNLGVVELTLALHKVFTTPKDKIIWDVGHQSYIHKILTGRKDQFPTLRQYKACQDSRSVKKASTMLLVQDIPAHPSQLLWGWL